MSNINLIQGDSFIELDKLEENSIDTCITDPPYGLSFMGKEWDDFTDNQAFQEWTRQWAEKVYRVLKPGAMCLVFGGTRTFHRITSGLEDAGFEIKDVIMWIYGEGFPKSYNIGKGMESKLLSGSANTKDFKELKGKRKKGASSIGYTTQSYEQGNRPADYNDRGEAFDLDPQTKEAKQWCGYGSNLKPAFEPIVLAMKPRDGTYVNNALKYGVAGLNIDKARIPIKDDVNWDAKQRTNNPSGRGLHFDPENKEERIKLKASISTYKEEGRWPANLILDEESARMLDRQTGGVEKAGFVRNKTDGARPFNNNGEDTRYKTEEVIEEKPAGKSRFFKILSVDRFFYCPKAKKKEKNEGLSDGMSNHHVTVKPIELLKYLCTLTKTPTGGTVLDPFMGSASTGIACILTNRDFIGIEKEEEYYEISQSRIKHFLKKEKEQDD
jgi:site-specific DNA-methyltransferase (adenine-specific)